MIFNLTWASGKNKDTEIELHSLDELISLAGERGSLIVDIDEIMIYDSWVE